MTTRLVPFHVEGCLSIRIVTLRGCPQRSCCHTYAVGPWGGHRDYFCHVFVFKGKMHHFGKLPGSPGIFSRGSSRRRPLSPAGPSAGPSECRLGHTGLCPCSLFISFCNFYCNISSDTFSNTKRATPHPMCPPPSLAIGTILQHQTQVPTSLSRTRFRGCHLRTARKAVSGWAERGQKASVTAENMPWPWPLRVHNVTSPQMNPVPVCASRSQTPLDGPLLLPSGPERGGTGLKGTFLPCGEQGCCALYLWSHREGHSGRPRSISGGYALAFNSSRNFEAAGLWGTWCPCPHF